jgi:hypothetical protein
MRTRTLTQSELAVRLAGLVAADLLRRRPGRALTAQSRPARELRGAVLPSIDAAASAGAEPSPPAVEAVDTVRHAVDLYLLACEPFPGAAALQAGLAAPGELSWRGDEWGAVP